MAYAEAPRAQISASIKYRSLKFSTLPNANANDIARALLFRVQLDELEAIQQDPGKGNWSIILKSISMAKSSLNVGECPNIIQPDNVENTPSSEASAGPTSENNTNIVAVAEDSTPVENSAELFTPPPASDNATTADHDISQAGSTLLTHEESPERSRSRSPLNKADVRKKSG